MTELLCGYGDAREDALVACQLFDLHRLQLTLAFKYGKLTARHGKLQTFQFFKLNTVSFGLFRGTLDGANLTPYLLNDIIDAQKVLVRLLELAQRFLFLRFEFGDACRLFKYFTAIIRL